MNKRSMSVLWRVNASSDAATDLVSVLDGARILAQSLAPNTEVVYSGMKTAGTDRKKIYLPPLVLGNEHPVPGELVDVFLGTTVHEIGHILFSPNKEDYIRQLTNSVNMIRNTRGRAIHSTTVTVLSTNDRRLFRHLIEVFEDMYVDHLMTGFPVYREYLAREREYNLGIFDVASVITPLKDKCSRMDMLNALIYFTLFGGKPPADISLHNLDVLAGILTEATNMSMGKSDKDTCIIRAWQKLCELPEFVDHDQDPNFKPPAPTSVPPIPGTDVKQDNTSDKQDKPDDKKDTGDDAGDKEDTGDTEDKDDEEKDESEEPGDTPENGEPDKVEEDGTDDGGDTSANDDEDKPAESDEPADDRPVWKPQDLAKKLDSLVDDDTPMDSDLAKDVSNAIIEKRDDLTQLISNLAGESQNTILAYTPEDDGTAAATARLHTSTAEERLRRILQQYKLRRTKDYHGLREGRISTNRLHRVAYGDTRVFQRREQPDEIDIVVCLLIDLSGSEQMNQELLSEIVCATSDALKKEKVEFIALGYSITSDKVYVPRLYDKETGKVMLNLEKEWGFTPSYEGLAVAIAQLLRLGGNKRKVLIHFTDGQPNSGNTDKIPELLTEARRKGIADIHLCVPGSDTSSAMFQQLYGSDTSSAMFQQLYGKDVREIHDVNEVPELIEKELREKLNENGG